MKRLYTVITVFVLISTVVGLLGWFSYDLPAKQESTYGDKTVQGEIPLSNIQSAFYWAVIWTLVGAALSFGFFRSVPFWPEKAVMIPSIGFIVGGTTYSVLKALALTKTVSVLSTNTMYISVAGWIALGIGAGLYRESDEVW